MEDFVHDLPLSIDFEQREQICVPSTGPVVEFKPHSGNGVDKVDVGNLCFEPRRWTVSVIPRRQ